nr:MAG TPA: hypothetical protein [Caudoviricetes sp.]
MNFYYCRLLVQSNLYYLLTLVLSCCLHCMVQCYDLQWRTKRKEVIKNETNSKI